MSIVIIPKDQAYRSDPTLEQFPYTVNISGPGTIVRWRDSFEWCSENLTSKFTWKGPTFYFTNKDDAVLFALRWA